MVDQEERQRAYQANLEFWKATCEYFKTFSTICLASIAAFAAFLAGFFATAPKNVENSMFSLIPFLSPKILDWFGNNRPIFIVIAFFAFGMAGFLSLGGMHDCRNALWDSRNVTAEWRFKRMRRYKRIARWRTCVVFSYTIATICFFIILALSIKVKMT